MTTHPSYSLPGLCLICHLRQTENGDVVCSDCRRVAPLPWSLERTIKRGLGWTANCIFDALLGFGVASILVMPIALVSTPPTPSLGHLQTWILGAVVLIVLAIIIGGVQSFILRDWIEKHVQWGLLNAASLFLIWPTLLGAMLLSGRHIRGITSAIEGGIGILIALAQALCIPEVWNIRARWVSGATLIWLATGMIAILVEQSQIDVITGVVYSFVTSRALFGALTGVWLGYLIWSVERRYISPQS